MAKNVQYRSTSPYYLTGDYRIGLDVMNHRRIPKLVDDVVYSIDPQYNYRPDLLANDLYDDPTLWWVFAARNPSILKDPTFDFRTGQQIYIPKKGTLQDALGI